MLREVEGRFPVRKTREGRAIAGLSMGGFGAVNVALRHAEVFAIAASMSGALDTMRATSVFAPEAAQPHLVSLLGPADGPARRDNDVYQLAATAPMTALPYLYLDCGTSDPWLAVNREFAQLLASRGIAHEFHEPPGGHDFDYWDRQIEAVLTLAAKRLR
jgi:putative tributyrin esterase